MTEPASPRKVQQALVYLAALQGDDPARVSRTEGLALRWRKRSDEHERAWQEAEQRWQLVHRLAPQLRGALQPQTCDPGRRRVLRQGGALALLLASGGWLGWMFTRTAPFLQDLRTAHAQAPHELALPDGSQLLVAAESNLRVRFDHGERQVLLLHGNVFFDVAHALWRPFVVSTRLGRVEVLGTAFTVSDRGDRVQVAVSRGRVQVRDLQGREQVLRAGERICLDGDGRLGTLRAGGQFGPDLAHWRRGWWSFTDQPLREVIGELNAYVAQAIEVDPGAADLRLTGSFPSDRPDVLLEALPRILPVRVLAKGGQQLIVHARNSFEG
ncbi:FecR domain-containing protein [Pseudomonas sp. GD03858]|uniref:FecR family protein n=1 Tax=unclassified Pseudomonas TaxID=196821 RepID=UPI00244AA5C0|nr:MULTISPECIES: FecR domain-containing protein [unclassified Pseudomonas]MDH0648658.1 FecR domain-containing protein [Pseudomonas sp. GD03867]MDH0661667.1 FecR domain-containing protein [Pseudomonas sp. GD03858]